MARMAASERRQKLLDAAIRVMTRDGLAAATVRAIVAEADMHVSTFHYCFDSKENLLREVMRSINHHNRDIMLSSLRPGVDVTAAVRDGLRAYWSDVSANPSTHRLTYELTQYVLRSPELEHLAKEQYQQYFDVARDFLAAIQSAARISWTVPVPVLSRMLVTFVDGLTLNWLVDRFSEQAEATLDTFAISLSGFAQPDQATGAA